MDKYAKYCISLARLNKLAILRGQQVESSEELVIQSMADNNKAIIESLRKAMEFFKNGFIKSSKITDEFKEELYISADVKSLFNRMLYMEKAILKSIENTQPLANVDEYEEVKNLILGIKKESPEEPQEEEAEEEGDDGEASPPSEEDEFELEDEEESDPDKENLKQDMYELMEAYPDTLVTALKEIVKKFFQNDSSDTSKDMYDNFSEAIKGRNDFTSVASYASGNTDKENRLKEALKDILQTTDSKVIDYIFEHVPKVTLKDLEFKLSNPASATKTKTKLPGGGSAPAPDSTTAPPDTGEENKAKEVVIGKLNDLIANKGTSGNILNTILSRYVSDPEKVQYTPEEIETWAEEILTKVSDDFKKNPENIVFTENNILDSMPLTESHLSVDPLEGYEKNQIPLLSDSFNLKWYRRTQTAIEDDYSFTPTGKDKTDPIYALSGEKEFEKVASLDSADTIIYKIENIYIALPKIRGLSDSWKAIIKSLGGIKCFKSKQIFKLKVKKNGTKYTFIHPHLEDYPQTSSADTSAATPDNFGLTKSDFERIGTIKKTKNFLTTVDLQILCGGGKSGFSNRLNVLRYLVENNNIKKIRHIPEKSQAEEGEILGLLKYLDSQGAEFTTGDTSLEQELFNDNRQRLPIINYLIPKVTEQDQKDTILTKFIAHESKYDPEIAQLLWNSGYKVTTKSYEYLDDEEKKRVDERLKELGISSADASTSTKAPLDDKDSILREVSSNFQKVQAYYSQFSDFKDQAESKGLEDSFKAEIGNQVYESYLWLDYFTEKNGKDPSIIDQKELDEIKKDLEKFGRASADFDKAIKDFEKRIAAGKSTPEPENKSSNNEVSTIISEYLSQEWEDTANKAATVVSITEASLKALRVNTSAKPSFSAEKGSKGQYALFPKDEAKGIYIGLPKKSKYKENKIGETKILSVYEFTGTGSIVSIQSPAIFSKSGDTYSLTTKGKLTVDSPNDPTNQPKPQNKKPEPENTALPDELPDTKADAWYDYLNNEYDAKKELKQHLKNRYRTLKPTTKVKNVDEVVQIISKEIYNLMNNENNDTIKSSITELDRIYKKKRNAVSVKEVKKPVQEICASVKERFERLISNDISTYIQTSIRKSSDSITDSVLKEAVRAYKQAYITEESLAELEKEFKEEFDNFLASYPFPPRLYFAKDINAEFYKCINTSKTKLSSFIGNFLTAKMEKALSDAKITGELDSSSQTTNYIDGRDNNYGVSLNPTFNVYVSSVASADPVFNRQESNPQFWLHKAGKENTYFLYPTPKLDTRSLSACYEVEGTGDTIKSITKPAVVYGTRYGSKSKDDTYILQQKGKLTLSGNSSTPNLFNEEESNKVSAIISDHLRNEDFAKLKVMPITGVRVTREFLNKVRLSAEEERNMLTPEFVNEPFSYSQYLIYEIGTGIFIGLPLASADYSHDSRIRGCALPNVYDFTGKGNKITGVQSPAIFYKSGDTYALKTKGKLTLG